MRLTAGLVAAVTLAAVSAVPAEAAKRRPVPKVCKIIADDPDDARPVTDPNVPNDDSLDIVGGDFATNGKKITGIIRIKALQQQNPRAPFGQIYFVTFGVKGVADTLTLSASLLPTGNQFKFGYDGVDPTSGANTSYTLGDATGSVTGNEIRITADISKFPQAKLLKNGNTTTSLGAEARMLLGQRQVPSQNVGPARVPLGGLTLTLDEATGKKYTLGAPSCVVIK